MLRRALPLILTAVGLSEAFHAIPASVSSLVQLHVARSRTQIEGAPHQYITTLPPRRNSQHALSLNMASPLGLQKRLAGAKKAIATAALAVSLSTMGVSGARAAAVADIEFDEEVMEDVELVQEDTEVDFTGMRKLSLGEQVIKYSILGGLFGGAAIYTFYEGKQADRDEEDRVKAEVERIEKWKAEFIDMDDVVSDDDLMASLNKRTSGEEGEDVKDLDGTGKIAADYDPEAEILKQQLAKTQKELEKKESEAKAAEEEEAKAALEDKPAEIDAEQMERLKRMFGGGEDAPKDK